MSRGLRRTWPWLVLAVGLVLMAPGMARLWTVEQSNSTYELTTGDDELTAFAQDGLDPDATLEALQDAGLRSVTLEMVTLADLERDGRAGIVSRGSMVAMMLASGGDPSTLPSGQGTFLGLPQGQDWVVDRLRIAEPMVEIEALPAVGAGMYFVAGLRQPAATPLGFDDARITELRARGLGIIARVPDTVTSVEFVTGELGRIRQAFGIDRILFSGAGTPFADDPQQLAELAGWLGREGFSVLPVEFFAPPGIDVYLRIVDRTIRLHGLTITSRDDAEDAIDRAIRGVKERNMRIFLVRPTATLDAQTRLDQMVDVMSGIVRHMPSSFEPGLATPFDRLAMTPMHALGGVLAATGIAAATGALVGTQAAAIAGAAMLVLAGLAAVSGSGPLGDLARLATAVSAAVLATFVARPRQHLGAATIEYLKAFIVVVIGGLVVVGLAYTNLFIVGAAEFFGVKVLLIGPAVVAALVAAHESAGRPGLRRTAVTLVEPVRVWHLVVLVAVAGVVGYLALRSDNTGAASDLELVFRHWLGDVFYVRPRTKEFLIGLPALLMGIAIAWRWRHGWWLYAVAAIGTASAIDTFTHFHAPMLASLLRTLIGFGLGYVVGLLGLGVAWVIGRNLDRWRPAR